MGKSIKDVINMTDKKPQTPTDEEIKDEIAKNYFQDTFNQDDMMQFYRLAQEQERKRLEQNTSKPVFAEEIVNKIRTGLWMGYQYRSAHAADTALHVYEILKSLPFKSEAQVREDERKRAVRLVIEYACFYLVFGCRLLA